MNWIVDTDTRSYDEWLATGPPNWRQAAMRGWLQEREMNGSPPIIGYTPDRFRIAEGPNGERVEFTELAKPLGFGDGPPFGIIFVRKITDT